MLTKPADADLDPRVARSRAKIRAAVVDRLCTDGYEAMAMEAIAEAAGVGKATVYRHWSSKAELTVDTLSCLKDPPVAPDTGDSVHDLQVIIRHMCTAMSSQPWSGLFPTLIDAAMRDPDLAAHLERFRDGRRAPIVAVLTRAIDRGELPADVDVQQAVDQLAGPVFYRRFVMAAPPDEAYAERLVAAVWRGLGGS